MNGLATAGGPVTGFALLVAIWWAMMAAMMLPVTLPWFRALNRLGGGGGGALARFGAGYFGIWLLFSVGAASLQSFLAGSGLFTAGRAAPLIGAAVLLVAGLYQLSPLKDSCLKHCRSPMSFFLSRWDDGPVGTLRLGVEHGLFCVGCCWALMLIGFAFGVMNVGWMLVLTGLVAMENLTRHGQRLSRFAGLAFILLAFTACG